MKTIGLIGGMSWESTTSYYQIINETIKKEPLEKERTLQEFGCANWSAWSG